MDTTELSKSEVLENWTFVINKAFRSSVKKSFQPNLNYVVMVTKLMSNGE